MARSLPRRPGIVASTGSARCRRSTCLPDPLKGERIKVFVVLRPGVPETPGLIASLEDHVRSDLGAIATPSDIAIRAALPKTRSGKIVRRYLKAQELGEHAARREHVLDLDEDAPINDDVPAHWTSSVASTIEPSSYARRAPNRPHRQPRHATGRAPACTLRTCASRFVAFTDVAHMGHGSFASGWAAASKLATVDTLAIIEVRLEAVDFQAAHRITSVSGTSGAAIAYDYKPCQPIAVREVAIGGRRDCRCLARRDHLVFVGIHGGGIAVLDISDPRAAQITATLELPGTELVDLALAGTTLYAADHLNGVHAIDVSDPKQPRHRAAHPALSHTGNRRVVVAGPLLVLVNDHAFSVFDVSTGAFRPLSLHHRMRSAVGWLRGVVLDGTRLHLTQGSMGVWTFDLADPTKPHVIGGQEPRLDTRPNERLICDSLARHGERIFAGTSSGIWALQLTASGLPESESFFTGPGTIREATSAVRDGALYVVALEPHDHVFHIFDVASGLRYMGRQRLSRMIERVHAVEHGPGCWLGAAGNAGVLLASY